MAVFEPEIIEFTNVKKDADTNKIRMLCKTAIERGYGKVCVNSAFTKVCKEELRRNSEITLVSTVGFPNGTSADRVKTYEAIVAAENGAREIDYMINLGYLKNRQNKELESEMKNLVRNMGGMADIKVIIEASLLTPEEITRVCKMAMEAGAKYIKTGTGFEGPATPEMVKKIREVVGRDMLIKAAGGVRDMLTAEALIAAGADFIGTSTDLFAPPEPEAE